MAREVLSCLPGTDTLHSHFRSGTHVSADCRMLLACIAKSIRLLCQYIFTESLGNVDLQLSQNPLDGPSVTRTDMVVRFGSVRSPDPSTAQVWYLRGKSGRNFACNG